MGKSQEVPREKASWDRIYKRNESRGEVGGPEDKLEILYQITGFYKALGANYFTQRQTGKSASGDFKPAGAIEIIDYEMQVLIKNNEGGTLLPLLLLPVEAAVLDLPLMVSAEALTETGCCDLTKQKLSYLSLNS